MKSFIESLEDRLITLYHSYNGAEGEHMPVDEAKQAILNLIEERVIDGDIDPDFDDYLDDITQWGYYDDYLNNTGDFVRGYNKAKSEQRAILRESQLNNKETK